MNPNNSTRRLVFNDEGFEENQKTGGGCCGWIYQSLSKPFIL